MKQQDPNIGRRVLLGPKYNNVKGEITGIFNGMYQVIDDDGMEWPVKPEELTFIDMDIMQQRKLLLSMGNTSMKVTKTVSKKEVTVEHKPDLMHKELEIDLHKWAKGHTPWEKMANQLALFREELEKHKAQHGVKIIFIHGSGVEDRLRNEMIKILKKMRSNFKYMEAPSPKYKIHTALKVIVL